MTATRFAVLQAELAQARIHLAENSATIDNLIKLLVVRKSAAEAEAQYELAHIKISLNALMADWLDDPDPRNTEVLKRCATQISKILRPTPDEPQPTQRQSPAPDDQ